jgi:hypothetical protein
MLCVKSEADEALFPKPCGGLKLGDPGCVSLYGDPSFDLFQHQEFGEFHHLRPSLYLLDMLSSNMLSSKVGYL